MTSAVKCACGRPATATIDADLLDGVVHIAIGACDLHAPTNDAEALNAIRALLAGIARSRSEVEQNRAGQRGGRGRRG